MKYFSRQRWVGLLLGLFVLAAQAQAEDFRIGLVNLDRIMREASTAKAAQAKLEQEFSKREKEMNDQGNAFRQQAEKFEREAPTLSDGQRNTRQKQLAEQDRELQRKRREFQEDLNTRKSEELQQFIDRTNKVVKQVAEAEKYDVILQEAVYVNPKHDITDKVIKALNAAK